jgi:nitrogen fixation protein FixH
MTKWEYANIRTFRSWDKKAKQFTKWQVYYTSQRTNVPLVEGLREMGSLGWELVTALPTSILSASTGRDGGAQVEVHETVLLFKRPIPEETEKRAVDSATVSQSDAAQAAATPADDQAASD